MQKKLQLLLSRFLRDTDATVLLETLIAVPVLTIFAVGVLEFGNIFWQRQQVQIATRDAARYWSRCRPDFSSCSVTVARNLAFYGNPEGTGGLRVPGWSDPANLVIEPAVPPAVASPSDIVRVSATLNYLGSPMIRLALPNAVTVTYAHQERYIGW